jgi:aromatic-L-amino-acid/L-tryptophan decarboxylase
MDEPSPVASRATDLTGEEFRRHAERAAAWIARYLDAGGELPVLPAVAPGVLHSALPARAPEQPEPLERILADFESLIVPATTHWNHPGFLAYFAVSGSAPGILGELLAAALNVNAMLWRTGPAATELEEISLAWLRQMLGLPPELDGTINDTASISTFHALAAAREVAVPGVRQDGLAGRDLPRLRVYCSEEAHSSVDKAVAALGMGLSAVRRLPTDADFRMDVAALETAVAGDRAAGALPVAVVATAGTSGVTAIDPCGAIADVCARERIWLHVDAAYGGAAAAAPELRPLLAGWERADSIVVNPHKWLFVPIDCSVLYTRRPDALRRAFTLVPDYLTSPDTGRNLMDYGLALGRRFRALKLWFVLRAFGTAGIADRVREHIRLARLFAGWVDESGDFERLAPVPLSVVAFRRNPGGLEEAELDRRNAALLDRVNASGEVFLSHTRVAGRYAIRLAVGNIRTTELQVRRAWQLLQ